jgi:predicted 3-demethylubiquinone-9 3-methyltransferase (glyoxalase superfamily)
MRVNATGNITPYLWFNNTAEEAMHFYTTLFAESKIESIAYYPVGSTEDNLKGMEGKVIHGVFTLSGLRLFERGVMWHSPAHS